MYLNNPHRSRARTWKKYAGFTLLEVLVSMAIFAFLAIGAQQVLSQIYRSDQISQQRGERLKALQRAMVYMDNDFRQMALRQTRTNGQEPSQQLLLWGNGVLDSELNGVMFARRGWLNPAQQFPRGEVTKVGYRIKDQVLERVWWHYADTSVGDEGKVMPLIDQVEQFEMRFWNGKEWLSEWDKPLTLPSAVEVRLTLSDYGEISRIYLTGGGSLAAGSSDEG